MKSRFISSEKNALAEYQGVLWWNGFVLEQIPEELVVDLMVELHLWRFDEGPQRARAAIRGGLLQIGVTPLNIFAEKRRCPICFSEVC
jgi:hypothetical protein